MSVERKLILSDERIGERVQELGEQISTDYQGTDLVMIGVLNGAFIFLADLTRAVSVPQQIDFVRVASYGNSSSSSGKISLSKDVELDIKGKHVLLVEDIVDTGTTLAWLAEHFKSKQAASVKVCVLIDKKERREKKVAIDYSGFVLEKGFLVGYGLDYSEQYRYLSGVYSLSF